VTTTGAMILKNVCLFAFIGLVAAKFEKKKFDHSNKHKLTKNHEMVLLNFDPNFCNDFKDWDMFPHPDNCKEYLMCWDGELFEKICAEGELFDPFEGYCDDAANVICLDEPWPEPDPEPDFDECPPPGSSEIRFLPSIYCDEFYICINGQPILLQCRPGQHWNIDEG
jgi:Chitin binding Peritrophin-A domain